MSAHPATGSASPLKAALASLRPGLWAAGGISAVLSLLMLTGSIYMLQVYDRVLSSGSVPTLMVLFGLVVVLYGFMAFYDGLRQRLMSRLALRLDAALAARAFRADLMPGAAGGAVRDLEALRGALAGPAVLALFDLPFTLLFLAVLFAIHPLLGWLTVGGMGMAAVLALVNRAVTAAPLGEALAAEAGERGFAERARRAAPALGALGMGGAVTAHWQALHRRGLAANQRGGEPSETLAAASRSLRMLLQSALLTAGAWLVLQGAISAGAIIASSILAGRALAPVDALIGQWKGLARAIEARRRLGPALEGAARPAPMALPAPTGQISVRGLTRLAPARPGQGERGQGERDRARLLDDITFALAPGDGLGIIGASASGKSTLARLLVGALQPDAGEIRLDGATPDQWDPDTLGRHIGYLPQQVELLPGTVRDNIARFDPAATDEAVIEAARAAGVHEMILALPDGYATDLSREMPLSGGQVQRVALARALYGNPSLLVLDEPNAHLDVAGEAALTRALQARRAAGATVIVIAHRAGALAAVNHLIVLQGGRVVQQGPRDAVLQVLGTPPAPEASQIAARISSPIRISSPGMGAVEVMATAASPQAQIPVAAQRPAPLGTVAANIAANTAANIAAPAAAAPAAAAPAATPLPRLQLTDPGIAPYVSLFRSNRGRA